MGPSAADAWLLLRPLAAVKPAQWAAHSRLYGDFVRLNRGHSGSSTVGQGYEYILLVVEHEDKYVQSHGIKRITRSECTYAWPTCHLYHSSERFQSSGEYAVFAKPNRNRVAPPPTLPLGRTLPHALKRSIICTSHLVPARERASPVLFHLGGSVSWQLWALPFRRGAVAWRAWPATVASACASSAGACPRNVPLMSWAARGRASLWDAQARCACLVGLGRFGDACSPCQWGLLALRRPLSWPSMGAAGRAGAPAYRLCRPRPAEGGWALQASRLPCTVFLPELLRGRDVVSFC